MKLKRLAQAIAPRAASPLRRAGIAPGLFHYQRESGGTFTRFHLRADPSGGGLLMANATAVARLRPSGVIIAKGLLDGDSQEAIVARLQASFQGLTPARAADDVADVRRLIAELDSPGDNYPILNLLDPGFTSDAVPLGRPISADLRLAGPADVEPILRRLWDLGIPHVTLDVPAGADPHDAVRAVELAEDLGLIAGVRGFGTTLAGGSLVDDLAAAGLDHLDVYFFSHDERVHDALAGRGDHRGACDALRTAHENEVCPVAVVVLVRRTAEHMEETIAALAEMGISNAGFFALATEEDSPQGEALRAEELFQAFRRIEEAAEDHDMRLLWYPPVRFDPRRPLAEQIAAGPRASGDQAVRVEPGGAVVPARGPFRPAGNLLSDDWETIWESPVYRDYRRLIESDEHCDRCPGLVCRPADCPRNPRRWAEPAGDV
jgi:MoaA/NifB/PqqE/SkfB family radical SAM enzyme